MRNLWLIASLLLVAGILNSCQNTRAYEKHVKELDSLRVVLQQSVANFKTVDSAQCVLDYSKYHTYITFLESHLNDTIPKSVAQNLQNFQSVGKGLHDFIAFRSSWLNEAELTIAQLQTLSTDLKSGSIEEDEAIEFILEEKKQALSTIDELKINTETIRKHLEIFNQSLPGCEALIKQENNGIIPDLLQPEIKHEKTHR
ncbi:MAG: hypothetical protein K0R26_2389 [Bacteroidota bacterium]|jgi:hypothetical protein|nr:hypothetical protein [Bacteroidota bacterium]